MTGRCRTLEGTLEERVWKWLRQQETPVKLINIMEQFGLSRKSASHVMRRLMWKGSIERYGRTHNTSYKVLSTNPEDMRGLSPGSHDALAKYSAVRTNPERKMHRPNPGYAGWLEAFWRG